MRQMGSLLVRLNLETRSFHSEVDKPWLDLIAGDRQPPRLEYMHCLLRAYGFDSPLEAALRYTKNFDQLVDMTGRYRAGFIAQDLLSLDGFAVQRIGGGIALGRAAERLELTFAAENLTDRYYREQFQFAPSRGRSFTVGIRAGVF